MKSPPVHHAFEVFGIELEYMIVDRDSMNIRPIADLLLRDGAGRPVCSMRRDGFAWSNELTLHLIEIKNDPPSVSLAQLPGGYQAEVREINRLLASQGARLMPGAMHPWMDPAAETRLWPHAEAHVYRAYERVFGCHRHGQSNLQSMHINLPFADDGEFARLHAAIRLLLPILPAIAASSPFAEGRFSGYLDYRMEVYRGAVQQVPAAIGAVVPDTVDSRAEYEARILAPMYRDLAPLDPQGVLRHEWLNARGAIPRFERNAIEIRVIDMQECPQADLAVAAAATAVVRAIYAGEWAPLPAQQGIGTDALARILRACILDAEQAHIDDAEYLKLLGFPGRQCRAEELWRHLLGATSLDRSEHWREPLGTMLEHGPLARRILRAVGPGCPKARQLAVYRELCDCLDAGRMFIHG